MGKIWGSPVVLLLVLSAPGRAEIRQPVSAEALEGAELNLTCSHPSASSDNIAWYRQFPNRGPEFIVTGFRETAQSPDPEGTLHISKDKENSTFALRRLRLADAAVYYCARRDTVGQPGAAPYNKSPTPGLGAMAPGRADIQQPGFAEGLEGAELNLTCSHPSVTSPSAELKSSSRSQQKLWREPN
ncbi:unnamed protein product [Caretta caretta]